MEVLQCLSSLLELHGQLQRAVALQGEIQAQVLAQLLQPAEPRRLHAGRLRLDEEGGDLEACLAVLETDLAGSRPPRGQWGSHLTELLTEALGMEGRVLPGEPDYEALKAGLRGRVWALEDQRWRDFSAVRYDLRGPRVLGRGVEEATRRWLRPERRCAEEVARSVALHRFISLLPEEAGDWLLTQHPRDMKEAVSMAEHYLRTEEGDSERDGETMEEGNRERDGPMTGQGHPAESPVKPEQSGDTNAIDAGAQGAWPCEHQPLRLCQAVTFNLEVGGLEEIYFQGRGPVEEDSAGEELPEVEVVIGPSFEGGRPDENAEGERPKKANNPMTLRTKAAQSGVSVISVSGPTLGERGVSSLPDESEAPPSHSYKCPDCGRSFGRQGYLRMHRCVSVQRFVCPYCERAFASRKRLTHHRRIHEKPLHCPDCGKPFRDRYNLRCHQRTHTGERPHLCPDCGAAFAQEKGLQEHRNIHTGARPFLCGVCGNGFRHSRTLHKHMVLHSQERPFLCAVCGKTFKLKDNLIKHQVTHDPREGGQLQQTPGHDPREGGATSSNTRSLTTHERGGNFSKHQVTTQERGGQPHQAPSHDSQEVNLTKHQVMTHERSSSPNTRS